MSSTQKEFKALVKDMTRMQNDEEAFTKKAESVQKAREKLATQRVLKLLKRAILEQSLLKHYTWRALWSGYEAYQYARGCKQDPTPVTLGVTTDSCKGVDPIARLLEQVPGALAYSSMKKHKEVHWGNLFPSQISLEPGVTLELDPSYTFAKMTYVVRFKDVDVIDFLPWFEESPANAVCMANAQKVADFVTKHELKVLPPDGFKTRLDAYRRAVEEGEKVAGLIQMVGFKSKAPKKPKIKAKKK